jgi:hypothetical protein
MDQTMHPSALSQAIVRCAYCGGTFTPRKRWGAFCSAKCRNGFDVDIGAQGSVASVRKLKHGVSITIHFRGPSAQRAMNLELGQIARLTRTPQ